MCCRPVLSSWLRILNSDEMTDMTYRRLRGTIHSVRCDLSRAMCRSRSTRFLRSDHKLYRADPPPLEPQRLRTKNSSCQPKTIPLWADASPSPLPLPLPRLNELLHGPRWGERTAIDNATLTIRPLVKVQNGGRAQPREMLGDLFEVLTAQYVVWFAETGTPRHG